MLLPQVNITSMPYDEIGFSDVAITSGIFPLNSFIDRELSSSHAIPQRLAKSNIYWQLVRRSLVRIQVGDQIF